MSQDKLIKITNKETGTTYYTRKNKKTVTKKIALKKYDKKLRKRVVFKESKK
jgi:large subunit ribosomal protein L33